MIKFEDILKSPIMKRSILFVFVAFQFLTSAAISLHVPASGLLGSMIADRKITELTLTGYLDARDVVFMFNELPNLQQLDMGAVSILEYNVEGESSSFPANVMPEYSFYNSYTSSGKPSLTSVVLPQSLTGIGLRAFENCSGLTSIVIPAGVTNIGRSAFQNCTSLTSLIVPDSVTVIGNRAFEYCIKLSKLTLPKSLSSIGEYAFKDCEELLSITAYSPLPVDITQSKSVFENAHPNCVLFLPMGSEKAYRMAAQWQEFVKMDVIK